MLCLGSMPAAAIEQDSDGVYQITSVQDWNDFADFVNYGTNTSANAVLTTDLSFKNATFVPIGCGVEDTTNSSHLSSGFYYSGTFDGQCHVIDNIEDLEKNALGADNCIGLFGVVSGGAHIKNVIVGSNCFFGGSKYVGGIVGATVGTGTVVVENCGNEAYIFTSGANAAGIIGVNLLSEMTITIRNCYNAGTIKGYNESAAICGWLGKGAIVQNCYNIGEVTGLDNTYSFARRQTATFVDCWDSMCMQEGINKITDDLLSCMATGEFCYASLNKTETSDIEWYQTIGVDEHPVPLSTHGTVYAIGELNCDGSSKGGTLTYSNTDESIRDPHTFVDGFCSVCGAMDNDYLSPAADGFYELASSADLYWFAVYTKSFETRDLSARLTADIEYAKTERIGSDTFRYQGTFDGQGHTVSISFIFGDEKEDRCALFDTLEGATVENLIVEGTITTAGVYAGGLAVEAYGQVILRNNLIKTHITSTYSGDGTHGGIIAIARENLIIENCAFVGELNALYSQGSAGAVGYVHQSYETIIKDSYIGGTLNLLTGSNNANVARHDPMLLNVWVKSDLNYASLDGEQYFDSDAMASGQLCYTLNEGDVSGVWHQTLGTDDYPIPFNTSEVVYAHGNLTCGGEADGTITFSNEEGELIYAEHEYGTNGICVNCENAYQISDVDQLIDFSYDVLSGYAVNAYAELTNDIDLSGVTYVPIGARTDEGGYPFGGTFDGKGHRIYNMNINVASNNEGFFGVVTDGAKIRNIVIDESCSVTVVNGDDNKEHGYAAGLIGATQGIGCIYIDNCGNEADVSVAGANAAGILGVVDLGHIVVYMTNCYNTGAITGGRESAGICAWLAMGSVLTNCWSSGTINEEGLDGDNTFYRNSYVDTINCYETFGSQVTNIDPSVVSSGELTYMLNEGETEDVVWYQTLGSDEHPVFDTDHGIVYYSPYTHTYTNSSEDGIDEVEASLSSAAVEGIYSIDGMRLSSMKKGINILRLSDGSARKVLVK